MQLSIQEMNDNLQKQYAAYLKVDSFSFRTILDRPELNYTFWDTPRFLPQLTKIKRVEYPQVFEWKKKDKTFFYLFAGKDVYALSKSNNWIQQLKDIVQSSHAAQQIKVQKLRA
jgi:hypothetical protein